MAQFSQRLAQRLRVLERQLATSLDDGADPDGYNVGWLEGAIYELRALQGPGGAPRHLVLVNGEWTCPECNIVIYPEEEGCGCGRRRPPRELT